MKPDYDALTPAQKAKFTRLSNKLDDQREGAYLIQREKYQKKADELRAELAPTIEAIRAESDAKSYALKEQIDELKKQMEEIQEERSKKVNALYDAMREEYAPEWKAYMEALDLANEWRKLAWKQASNELWKEFGFEVEEVKKEQETNA